MYKDAVKTRLENETIFFVADKEAKQYWENIKNLKIHFVQFTMFSP